VSSSASQRSARWGSTMKVPGESPSDFVPHEPTIHEAQGGMCLGVGREMWIKVGGSEPQARRIPPRLGCPASTPRAPGGMQRPGRQRHTSGEAGFQQFTTAYTLGLLGVCWLCVHREPSLESVTILHLALHESSSPQPRVEQIPQCIPQHIEPKHGQADSYARPGGHPGALCMYERPEPLSISPTRDTAEARRNPGNSRSTR